MQDITKGLSIDVLKLIYNSKFEIVIILNNGTIIETNNEENVKKYEKDEDLSYIFFKSDFETIYAIKNELKARKKTIKIKGYKMQKINLTNEMIKRIESNEYYSKEDFIKDCQTYIKALKSGRLQYRVTNVSKSGMSRDILISSFEGKMTKGYYRNYVSMLEVLGFNFVSKYASEIRVKGSGMNMLFATNYNIIHTFKDINLISKKQSEVLSQIIN